MKSAKAKSNVITAYQHKGYNVYVCDHAEGYYTSIMDSDGNYVDCSPYRYDIESVKEIANTIIDSIVADFRKSFNKI